MSHTMSVKQIKGMGASIATQAGKVWKATHKPPQPFKETAVDKALRVSRQKLDKAEIKYHEDSRLHLKQAKAALAIVEKSHRKAYLVHERASKK